MLFLFEILACRNLKSKISSLSAIGGHDCPRAADMIVREWRTFVRERRTFVREWLTMFVREHPT